ncbi:MAG TPA: CHAT domain-containing protein [Pyrinomonadaceae bacterium]|nr:CHAT domain-containing protein [Pyrinomonadaceae bacterium]
MEYQNFDLQVEGKPGESYRVRVQSEGMDDIEGLLDLSPECRQIVDRLQQVETLEEGSSLPMDLGSLLYRCLFHDDVRDRMLLSFGGVFREAEKGMRIRLMLSPPELAALPWEFLCDPNTKSYFATSGKTPLIRYIASREPINLLRVESPVRMLVLIPSGSGLDTAKEEEIITQAVRASARIELKIMRENVTYDEIGKALIKKRYHIVHFVGHGQFKSDQGYLEIDKDEKHDGLISADDFAALFKDYPSLKLAVLNCCQGGQLSPKEKYAGIAAQLVALGVPAVVAMQYRVSDDAALVFAREFYLKLCDGWARGQVDTAVSYARHQILRQVKDEPIAFATPVLFLRSDNSIIFDLAEESDDHQPILKRFMSLLRSEPAKHRDRLEQVKEARKKNIEAWQEKTKDSNKETRLQAIEAIAEERAELTELDQRIVRWNRAIPASLLATFLMFLAGYAGLFNVVHADDWLEATVIPYMDEFVAPRFSPDVRVILADQGNNGGMGEPDASWRQYHSSLIKGLTEAGAKVIVFDINLDGDTGYDKSFAEAITVAESRGTRVILGKGVDASGKIVADLPSELNKRIADNWGNFDVGGARHGGVVRIYQLGQSLGTGSTDQYANEKRVTPSLALQTASTFLTVKPFYNEEKDEIELRSAEAIVRRIPIEKNQQSLLDFRFCLADGGKLNEVTSAYDDVYRQLDNISYLKERFQGTIVLVGFKTPDDLFSVLQAKHRYGTEIHANVISNILGDVYVRLPSTYYNILILAIMTGIGALVRARFSHNFAFRFAVPFTDPKKRLDVPGLLVGADVVYLLIAFLLYKNGLIYILQTYHLVAPFVAYWLTGKLRRKAMFRPLKGTG